MRTWNYTLGELLRRPGRTLLTLSGVAIGVAVAVAAGGAIDSARNAYRNLFDCAGNRESLEIVAPGNAGFDGGFASSLEAVPGTQAVSPRVVATTALAALTDSTPARVFGLKPEIVARWPPFSLSEGQPFAGPASLNDGIWLDHRTARSHGWTCGTVLTLLAAEGEVDLPVKGLVEPRGGHGVAGSSVVYLPLTTAQRLFVRPGQVNSVEITLADRADPETTKRSIAAELPAGLQIQSGGRRGELSHATLQAVEHGLTALSLIALIAAGFVVLNTAMLNLSERRKQLAILKAIGATRGQLQRLLLREALLVGLAGSLVGVGAGLLLAAGLSQLLQKFLAVSLAPPRVSGWLLAGAIAAGPILTAVATFAATRRAAGEPPLHDLVNPTAAGRETVAGPRQIAGITLLALSLLIVAALGTGGFGHQAAPVMLAPALAGLLAGCALIVPAAAMLLLHGLSKLPQRFFGVTARLALWQLLRRPARTGLTTGVLFIAMTSAVSFGHWLLNTLDDLHRWYKNAIVADFLVRGSVPDSSFLLTAPVSEKLEAELASISGVERVEKVSFLAAEVNERPVLALARTFAADRSPTLDLRDGDPAQVVHGLRRGELVLGTALAQKLGVRAGDTVSFASRHGPVKRRIAGTAVEYAAGGDALYLEWDAAKELLAVPGVHVYLIAARPGAGEVLAMQLQVFCLKHQLMLQSNADLRELIDRLLRNVSISLWAIVALIFAVSSFGVANTLTLNVLEQTRDLSLLRAIGMVSGQTRSFVLSQALLLAAVSLSLGAVVGIGLAALINQATNAVFGQQVAFRIDWLLTFGCLLVGGIITTLAALVPSRQAVRLANFLRAKA